MNNKERRRNEDKSEFNGFRDPCQERGKSRREQDTSSYFGNTSLANHSQACRGQPEHHNGEEASHKVSRSGISGEVTCQITMYKPMGSSKVPQLQPDIRIEHMVQTNGDEQAVQEAINARTDRAKRYNTRTQCVDRTLNWSPDQTENKPKYERNQCSNDRNEAPTAKESKIIR